MAGREGPQYGEEVEEKVGTTTKIAVIFIIPVLMRKFEEVEEKVGKTTRSVIAVFFIIWGLMRKFEGVEMKVGHCPPLIQKNLTSLTGGSN